MKELLEVIIKGIVNNKDAVVINEVVSNNNVQFKVKVDKSDMGPLIGKQGRMASSIRSVMKAVANQEHKRVSIEFIEN